eukprot:c6940_g2_i2.p1 GENE.c6940_g2_i2~~c6940_g2_i2.p1  ORF type:complete len:106 (-),score=9.14 c6940_g2_i2:169-486(-)
MHTHTYTQCHIITFIHGTVGIPYTHSQAHSHAHIHTCTHTYIHTHTCIANHTVDEPLAPAHLLLRTFPHSSHHPCMCDRNSFNLSRDRQTSHLLESPHLSLQLTA